MYTTVDLEALTRNFIGASLISCGKFPDEMVFEKDGKELTLARDDYTPQHEPGWEDDSGWDDFEYEWEAYGPCGHLNLLIFESELTKDPVITQIKIDEETLYFYNNSQTKPIVKFWINTDWDGVDGFYIPELKIRANVNKPFQMY